MTSARLQATAAETARLKEAPVATKLAQIAPLAKRRAEDYKDLMGKNFISQHGYLEKEQTRIEQERDRAFKEAEVRELAATVEEVKRRRQAHVSEFERLATAGHLEVEKKAAQLEQELIKARTREHQQQLTAPVDGTVQQLAVHTQGDVVIPAQALKVIAPADYHPEVEATLKNKDVGFVKVGQKAEIKVETFPFTRYGTLPGTVTFVSHDAVYDEEKGSVFQVRVRLEKPSLKVDERTVPVSPGMAVSAEFATETRRVISYFFDPVRKSVTEGFRGRWA